MKHILSDNAMTGEEIVQPHERSPENAAAAFHNEMIMTVLKQRMESTLHQLNQNLQQNTNFILNRNLKQLTMVNSFQPSVNQQIDSIVPSAYSNLITPAINHNFTSMSAAKVSPVATLNGQNCTSDSIARAIKNLFAPALPRHLNIPLAPTSSLESFCLSSSELDSSVDMTSTKIMINSPSTPKRSMSNINDCISHNSKDRPLDLRTVRKRKACDNHATTSLHLGLGSKHLEKTRDMQQNVSSCDTFTQVVSKPQLFQPSIKTLQAVPALNQQLVTQSPHLQNLALPVPIAQNLYGQQLHNNVNSLRTTNQNYLQKLLLETPQQHHQAENIDTLPQNRLKMQNNMAESNGQELSFHSITALNKKTKLSNRRTSSPLPKSTSTGQQLSRRRNSTPSSINRKRYKRYSKPPYSYVSLITLAILSSPDKKLRLADILKRIAEMFPFFTGPYTGWKDSVRHNLSQSECFIKVLKNPCRPSGKGNFWCVNIDAIPHELVMRQNTSVSRCAQDSGYRYRKDLTEIFDLSTGKLKVSIPRRFISSTGQVTNPGAVMHALLLVEKSDDDSTDLAQSNNGNCYSLIDIFNHNNDFNSVLHRHHGGNRWSSKANKKLSNSNNFKSGAVSLSELPLTGYPSYRNAAQSQNLAVQMMQPFNCATVCEASNNQMAKQAEAWNRILSGQLASKFPFYQYKIVNSGLSSQVGFMQSLTYGEHLNRLLQAYTNQLLLDQTTSSESEHIGSCSDSDHVERVESDDGHEKNNKQKNLLPTNLLAKNSVTKDKKMMFPYLQGRSQKIGGGHKESLPSSPSIQSSSGGSDLDLGFSSYEEQSSAVLSSLSDPASLASMIAPLPERPNGVETSIRRIPELC